MCMSSYINLVFAITVKISASVYCMGLFCDTLVFLLFLPVLFLFTPFVFDVFAKEISVYWEPAVDTDKSYCSLLRVLGYCS